MAEHLAAINRHEARIKQLTQETSAKLSAAHVEGCIEREFVDGGLAALDMSRERVGAFFIIQRDFFREADKILAFLEEKSGHYSIKNGNQFAFSSDEDKALFDFLMINLKQVSMRESEWARQMLEKQSKEFPALQSFAQ